MKSWKVLIQYEGRTMEIIIDAYYYSSVKYTAEDRYPGCRVCSITESRLF